MIKDKTTFKLTGEGAPVAPAKKAAKKPGKKAAVAEKKEEEVPAAAPVAVEASPKKKRAAPPKAQVGLLRNMTVCVELTVLHGAPVSSGQEGQGVPQEGQGVPQEGCQTS